MQNIIHHIVVTMSQFSKKIFSVASQNNTRQLKVKLFPAACNNFHVAGTKQFH